MRWLTEQLPGTGGSYKESAEDFEVEEIPLYPCCGSGEHLYLWIEKQGISTRYLVEQLARGLKLKEREIGYAGLKDSRATTRQMISVPASLADACATLELDRAQILTSQRHSNKLRLGHLAGNRFRIRLTGTVADAADRAEKILAVLERQGVPNLFGEQRYGILGNSATLGVLLLQGKYQDFCRELIGDPQQIRNSDWQQAARYYHDGDLQAALERLPKRMRDEQKLLKALLKGGSYQQAVLSLPRSLLRLFLSAAQSRCFDQLVSERLPDLDRLLPGDIAIKHINGACFRVEDAASEQLRADQFEISPTAPLFGSKVMLAEGEPGVRERRLLKQAGLGCEQWDLGQGLTMPGERRALRAPVQQSQIVYAGTESLILSFILPKGTYATTVLHEVIK